MDEQRHRKALQRLGSIDLFLDLAKARKEAIARGDIETATALTEFKAKLTRDLDGSGLRPLHEVPFPKLRRKKDG